jgi:hypothetical protein
MLNFIECPSTAQRFVTPTTLGNFESDFTNGCNSSSKLSSELQRHTIFYKNVEVLWPSGNAS